MGATSLLRWLREHTCFHLGPYWMHKSVFFDLGCWFCFIICIPRWWYNRWDANRRCCSAPRSALGPAKCTNVDYKVGIKFIQLPNKFRPGQASDINLQGPQPAHPGDNRPSVCCNFGMCVPLFVWLLGTSYTSQSYLLVKLSWGPYYYWNFWGIQARVSRPLLAFFFRAMAAASSFEDRILLLQQLQPTCNFFSSTQCLNHETSKLKMQALKNLKSNASIVFWKAQ